MKIEGTVTEVPAVHGRGAWVPSAEATLLFAEASVLADGAWLHVVCDDKREASRLQNWMKKQGFATYSRAKVNLYVGRNGAS